MSENKKLPPEEMIRIGILAAFMGGYLDAYTYVLHGGVFANTQTGNLILMTIYLFEKQWSQVLLRLIPILVFGMGILLFEVICKFNKKYSINIVLIIQAILILIIGFGAFKDNSTIVCSTISFICALQLVSFKKMKGLPYATIMCTGNLRSFSEFFSKWILYKNKEDIKKALKYLLIIFVFCFGVFAGMFFVNLISFYSILILLVNILIKYIFLHIEHKNGIY